MHCVLHIIMYLLINRNTLTLNYYLTTNFITTILMYNICVKWRKGGSFCEEKSNRWFFKAIFNNIYTIFVNKKLVLWNWMKQLLFTKISSGLNNMFSTNIIKFHLLCFYNNINRVIPIIIRNWGCTRTWIFTWVIVTKTTIDMFIPCQSEFH